METNDLIESLNTYESQLSQVNEALKDSDDEQYDSLMSLKSDLLELINLTKENIDNLYKNGEKEQEKSAIDDEYALFMEEMKKDGAYDEPVETVAEKTDDNLKTEEDENIQVDLLEELKSLEGMKCAVLFNHKWGGEPTRYNAMVSSVLNKNADQTLDYNNIKVRILFTNPTHIEMIPCPFYLDGECKFDDETCKYSHGEIVPLSSLESAIEPDFATIKIGSNILAKIDNTNENSSYKTTEKHLLWHRAIIKSIDVQKHICTVKLESNSLLKSGALNDFEIDLGNVFPLTGNEFNDSDDSSNQSDEELFSQGLSDISSPNNITHNLNINPSKLGDWEKHTKGMGSKLMIKMGYVMGTGLGPQKDGIMLPIPCQVLPIGRSLDHCMNLKEKFSSIDPIKAEKKMQRLQRKSEEQKKRAYERAKEKEKHDVFNFLNTTLAVTANKQQSSSSKKPDPSHSVDIKTSSCKNLNIEQFKLTEDIKKIEKDILKIQNSIVRNSKDSLLQKELSSQLNSKLDNIKQLKLREHSISSEQSNRKDKRKLTIF